MKEQTNRTWKIAVIILVCIAIIAVIGVGSAGYYYSKQAKQQKQQEKQAVTNDLQAQLSAISENISDPNVLETPIIETSSKATGNLGVMEKFTKDIFADAVTLRNNYFKEMEAIGYFNILDPNRIKADESLTESTQMIEKAKSIIKDYQQKQQNLLIDARKKIDKLEISESQKSAWIKGYNKSLEKNQKASARVWELEISSTDIIEKALTLLSENPDSWIAEDNQIVFYDDSVSINLMEEYNTYMNTMLSNSKEQQEIQLGVINQANEALTQ